jgi:hypothetical protein
MDKLNDTISSFTGGNNQQQGGEQKSEGGSGGFLGGLGDKINSAAGGGRESEKNEDYLDKGWSTFYLRLLSIFLISKHLTFIVQANMGTHRYRLCPGERSRSGQAGQ